MVNGYVGGLTYTSGMELHIGNLTKITFLDAYGFEIYKNLPIEERTRIVKTLTDIGLGTDFKKAKNVPLKQIAEYKLGSKDSGKSTAAILSLVQTCRHLGINPQQYLEFVLENILEWNSQKLDQLLPDVWLKSQG